MHVVMSAEPGRKVPYSTDLRWRMVWQRFAMELTLECIAGRLNVAVTTVHATCKKFEETGAVEPAKQPTRLGIRKLDEHHEQLILAILMENPSKHLHELCTHIAEVSGVSVSEATVCRLIRRHGLTRKKIRQIALQRSTEARALFMAHVLSFPMEFFVWIDETGSDARTYARKFGYSLRGMRAECHRLLVRGQRISAIAAIASDGLTAVELKTGTVNSDCFVDFVRGCLIPNMQPFNGTNLKSIAVMDNCSVHHVQDVYDLFNAAGILLLFLPPYSPDYNPIEEAFSYIKWYLKEHDDILQVRDIDPNPIIMSAFESITPSHCNGWITNSGYAY